MEIIGWLLFGALTGWIASLIMRTDAEQGVMANIVIGIIGAFIGGFIARLLGGSGVSGFNLYSLVVAVIGAVVLIAIIRAFARGGRHHPISQ